MELGDIVPSRRTLKVPFGVDPETGDPQFVTLVYDPTIYTTQFATQPRSDAESLAVLGLEWDLVWSQVHEDLNEDRVIEPPIKAGEVIPLTPAHLQLITVPVLNKIVRNLLEDLRELGKEEPTP